MQQADVMIIGGTGIGSRLARLGGRPLAIPTAEGLARGKLIDHQGTRIVLIQRHAAGHRTPPHAVNYKAMALAARALGVNGCLSTAAVGSLRTELAPGTMIACSDFVDLTARRQTIHGRDVVHTDFSEPMSKALRLALVQAASEGPTPAVDGAVYLCGDGPRYETPAEIRMMRTLGADLVGMTAATEAILFRECKVRYACLAIVTNFAAGMAEAKLDHGDVVAMMDAVGEQAVELLLRAAELVKG